MMACGSNPPELLMTHLPLEEELNVLRSFRGLFHLDGPDYIFRIFSDQSTPPSPVFDLVSARWEPPESASARATRRQEHGSSWREPSRFVYS
jgi:hypothetical protein